MIGTAVFELKLKPPRSARLLADQVHQAQRHQVQKGADQVTSFLVARPVGDLALELSSP
jgi:hypothetical protein